MEKNCLKLLLKNVVLLTFLALERVVYFESHD